MVGGGAAEFCGMVEDNSGTPGMPELAPKPREMPPTAPEGSSWMESPSRSSSTVVALAPDAASILSSSPRGSGSKSIRDNSLAAFLTTPVLVPNVPLGIFDAASTSPFLINLYRSTVRCMLSLISRSLATASESLDSSSHIFWILG